MLEVSTERVRVIRSDRTAALYWFVWSNLELNLVNAPDVVAEFVILDAQ